MGIFFLLLRPTHMKYSILKVNWIRLINIFPKDHEAKTHYIIYHISSEKYSAEHMEA